MMQRLILTLCVLFFCTVSVHAELYTCTDRNGSSIVTDNPQDGMQNCVLKDDAVQSTPEDRNDEKPAGKKENNVKSKDTPEARTARIKKCIDCCNKKFDVCYNYTADNRICRAGGQDCAAMCNSEGSSSASWSDCWTQSE